MKSIARLVTVLVLFGFLAVGSRAQTISGIISGRVVDPSGAVIPGASVKLVQQSTGVAISTKVLSDGNFTFPAVQPGTYFIDVHAPGFKEFKKQNLVLTANERLSAGTLTLQVGSVSQSVTVTAAVTPVNTTSAETSGELDVHQLDSELAEGRDFMAMLRTIPGVAWDNGGGSLGSAGTPYINGTRNVYNSASLDGVSGAPRPGQHMDTPPNLDAISEVKVLTAGYQAEYGEGNAGAAINVVTKSGTNRFHGEAYYYVRNEAFNANDWFNNYKGVPRGRYRYNTIGGNIGGPVYWPGHFNRNKNKLFFFYSQEYWPDQSPNTTSWQIPTQAEVNGDFSQTPEQGKVNPDPATDYINIKMPGASTSSCPASGTSGNHSGCFPGNKLPPGSINASTQALVKLLYTAAQGPGWIPITNRAISGGNYNYIQQTTTNTPTTQEIARVDYDPTEKLHMYARLLFQVNNDDGYHSTANDNPWLMKVNYQTPRQNIAYDVTYTFSPTLLNEFNFGTSTFFENQLYTKSQLALATKNPNGYDLGQINSANNPLNLYPKVSFGSSHNTGKSPSYGWDSRFPMYDRVRWWQANDNLTKIVGNHNMMFGVNLATDNYLQAHSSSGTPEGAFDFSSNSNNPNDSYYGYANALEGLFNTYSEPTSRNDYNPRYFVYEWFAQDQWKMTPKFTLDYGMRFSYGAPFHLTVGSDFLPSLYDPSQAPTLYQFAPGGKNAVDPTGSNSCPGGTNICPAAYTDHFVPNTGNLANGTITTKTGPGYPGHSGYPEGLVKGTGFQIGPRLGFAYDPHGNGKMAIRAHGGIFFGPGELQGQGGDMTHQPPIEFVPTEYYGAATSITSAGQLLGPTNFSNGFESNPKGTKIYEYGLQVQQEVGFGTVLSVGYEGNVSRHMTAGRNINEVPYGAEFLPQHQYCSKTSGSGCSAYSPLPDDYYRAFPGYSTITIRSTGYNSNYNSLQAQVTRRYANGLDFGLAYTWSKYMDVADEYDTGVPTYQPLRFWEYGPAAEDHRQNLVINYLYDLPKVSGALNNVLTRSILNNWHLSGFVTYLTAAPQNSKGNTANLSYSTTDSVNTTGGGDGARIVVTGNLNNGPKKFGEYFDTSVVQRPSTSVYDTATGQVIPTNGYTSLEAMQIYPPSHWDFQTALFKDFKIRERLAVELRLETYNTFNNPEFDGVDAGAKFGPFTGGTSVPTLNGNVMTNGTTTQENATFGQINSSAGPRVLQLAARIQF
ncbi:MAG TPA: TonB-dependent receptor [Terracidiphilus sp.]|nr:TonB-dependent receptor [Terracidiphilus sp.]